MSFTSQLALIKEMIENCESSLRSAKQLLNEMMGTKVSKAEYTKMAQSLPDFETDSASGKEKIVEGVFDGQNMVGKDKNTYPVPANYASKSKLIPGDVLKLTISPDGGFVYKQIGPTERKNILGTLTSEDGRYKVVAEGKVYNVLLASVTYFKGSAGDQVSLIVPAQEDSEWGALEAVIPQNQIETAMKLEKESTESKPAKKKKATKKKKDDDGISDLDI